MQMLDPLMRDDPLGNQAVMGPGPFGGYVRTPDALINQLREANMNRFALQPPVGGIRGPAPVMPQMPQVPTMQNLPMQGGMVDFNALAGQMAGPMPDLSQFFSSPAPVMSQPSPFVPPGTKGPQLPSPPGKLPQLQMPSMPMQSIPAIPAPAPQNALPPRLMERLAELSGPLGRRGLL